MHFLSHPVPTALRFDDRFVKKIREIINVSVPSKNHVAAAAAVTAIWSALWHKFLAPETDRATAAAPGLGKNLDAIDKHESLQTAIALTACHPERSEGSLIRSLGHAS